MTFAKSRRSYALVVLMVLMGLAAHAQNADNLTPYQSFVRTQNTNLNFSGSLTSAFKSVTLTCPASHSAGCTVVVQMSSQFWAQNCCDWGNFIINVSISGSGSQVWPNSSVKVGAMGSMMGGNSLSNAETFHWTKTGIPAGSKQTVNIKFQTDGFNGTAGYRTAIVHLNLN
jgi:hypothetical protein